MILVFALAAASAIAGPAPAGRPSFERLSRVEARSMANRYVGRLGELEIYPENVASSPDVDTIEAKLEVRLRVRGIGVEGELGRCGRDVCIRMLDGRLVAADPFIPRGVIQRPLGSPPAVRPAVARQLGTFMVGGRPVEIGEFNGRLARDVGGRLEPLAHVPYGWRRQPKATLKLRMPLADALRAEGRPPEPRAGTRTPDLVPVARDVAVDLAYAGTSNIFRARLYPRGAEAFLDRDASVALSRVARRLWTEGVTLVIRDAYRPWRATHAIALAISGDKASFASTSAEGSPHNHGCAVDVSLREEASGKDLELVAGFDELSERAAAYAWGGTSRARWFRQRLQSAMSAEGFSPVPNEWWHFNHNCLAITSVADIPFSQLTATR